MKDHLPTDHHVIVSALPDMREHFEQAAKNAPQYGFIFESVAEDVRSVERVVAEKGLEASRSQIEILRQNIISIAESDDYATVAGGDFKAALDIALRHKDRLGLK